MYRSLLILAVLLSLGACSDKNSVRDGRTEKEPLLNHLKNETSPYLLQHADNPVDWYPWGEEALERARTEDKPILLSIGYAACHWCHVMEHESFENEEIAALMNANFICIKVDREERPDLDQLYMTFVQMATGSGGWPMTVFMTPEQKPYFGGTYFPPEDRYGRPGFKKLLTIMADVYHNRKDELARNINRLDEAFERMTRATRLSAGLPGYDVLEKSVRLLAEQYEPRFGGIGRAPKFPAVQVFDLFLHEYARTGEDSLLDMVTHTLRNMAHGGIYDQLGGGFARYSTDERWLVPHFEKMLYDNALLAPLYLDAFLVTTDSFYLGVAEDILRFTANELTGPEGQFYSSLDADSEGGEGTFYIWSKEEIMQALGREEGALFCKYFGVSSMGNFEGRNILHVAVPADSLAEKYNMSPARLKDIINRGREKLLRLRAGRQRPALDDKALTAWNALMLSAYARVYQVTHKEAYAGVIRRNADFLLMHLYGDEGLKRSYKNGEARIDAFMEDYAYLIAALLDAYEALFDERWLQKALTLAEEVGEHFSDGSGGYYTTSAHGEQLYQRLRVEGDQSVPSPTGVMLKNNLRLYGFSGQTLFLDEAEKTLKRYGQQFAANPYGYASYLTALDFYLQKPFEILLIADEDPPKIFLHEIFRTYIPNKLLMYREEGRATVLTSELLEGRRAVDGQATAYVCRDGACSLPVTHPAELAEMLRR